MSDLVSEWEFDLAFQFEKRVAAVLSCSCGIVLSVAQQALRADTDRPSRDPHRMHLIVFDVVVDGAAIYVQSFGGDGDAHDLHVLATARAPYLFTEHKGLRFVYKSALS